MGLEAGARAREAPRGASELLAIAARSLRRRIGARDAVTSKLGPQDALAELENLVSAVDAVLEGVDPEAASRTILRPLLHARLIQALTDHVLRARIRPSEQHAALVLLRALSDVLAALHGPEDDDLRARLSQPDAFELLVEVAHDLRSPLTSVLFLSEALRAGHSGAVNPVQRSQLGLIYSAALGLASVTSDIVDLARDGRGLLEGEPEEFAIGEVFRGVADLVRPMAEEKSLELRSRVSDFDRLRGYPTALHRVMLNLAANALKFTEEGYVELGASRVRPASLEIYVRDTGRGISEQRQRDLFQPFKARADGRGQFFSGSGVGLTIARRLVRAMGSDLSLETAPEWGTRFSFVLDSPALS